MDHDLHINTSADLGPLDRLEEKLRAVEQQIKKTNQAFAAIPKPETINGAIPLPQSPVVAQKMPVSFNDLARVLAKLPADQTHVTRQEFTELRRQIQIGHINPGKDQVHVRIGHTSAGDHLLDALNKLPDHIIRITTQEVQKLLGQQSVASASASSIIPSAQSSGFSNPSMGGQHFNLNSANGLDQWAETVLAQALPVISEVIGNTQNTIMPTTTSTGDSSTGFTQAVERFTQAVMLFEGQTTKRSGSEAEPAPYFGYRTSGRTSWSAWPQELPPSSRGFTVTGGTGAGLGGPAGGGFGSQFKLPPAAHGFTVIGGHSFGLGGPGGGGEQLWQHQALPPGSHGFTITNGPAAGSGGPGGGGDMGSFGGNGSWVPGSGGQAGSSSNFPGGNLPQNGWSNASWSAGSGIEEEGAAVAGSSLWSRLGTGVGAGLIATAGKYIPFASAAEGVNWSAGQLESGFNQWKQVSPTFSQLAHGAGMNFPTAQSYDAYMNRALDAGAQYGLNSSQTAAVVGQLSSGYNNLTPAKVQNLAGATALSSRTLGLSSLQTAYINSTAAQYGITQGPGSMSTRAFDTMLGTMTGQAGALGREGPMASEYLSVASTIGASNPTVVNPKGLGEMLGSLGSAGPGFQGSRGAAVMNQFVSGTNGTNPLGQQIMYAALVKANGGKPISPIEAQYIEEEGPQAKYHGKLTGQLYLNEIKSITPNNKLLQANTTMQAGFARSLPIAEKLDETTFVHHTVNAKGPSAAMTPTDKYNQAVSLISAHKTKFGETMARLITPFDKLYGHNTTAGVIAAPVVGFGFGEVAKGALGLLAAGTILKTVGGFGSKVADTARLIPGMAKNSPKVFNAIGKSKGWIKTAEDGSGDTVDAGALAADAGEVAANAGPWAAGFSGVLHLPKSIHQITHGHIGKGIGSEAGDVGGTFGGMWAGAEGGAAVGAMTGAAIGSFFPVIGTAAGGIVGGTVGGIAGGIGGAWAGGHYGAKLGGYIGNIAQKHAHQFSHGISEIWHDIPNLFSGSQEYHREPESKPGDHPAAYHAITITTPETHASHLRQSQHHRSTSGSWFSHGINDVKTSVFDIGHIAGAAIKGTESLASSIGNSIGKAWQDQQQLWKRTFNNFETQFDNWIDELEGIMTGSRNAGMASGSSGTTIGGGTTAGGTTTMTMVPGAIAGHATILKNDGGYSAMAKWKKDIDMASEKTGVPAALIAANVMQESSGDATAGSLSGAYGLTGLEPAGASGPSYATNAVRKNPLTNILAGSKYQAQLIKHFGGSQQLGLAAYYAGQGTIQGILNQHHLGDNFSAAAKYLNYIPDKYNAQGDQINFTTIDQSIAAEEQLAGHFGQMNANGKNIVKQVSASTPVMPSSAGNLSSPSSTETIGGIISQVMSGMLGYLNNSTNSNGSIW